MSIRVGFGSADITPELPVALAGYYPRKQPAKSIHERLEARAVYFCDEAATLCLVCCDLLLMTPDFAQPIRDAIANRLGVDRAAVITSCVHTHAGPSTGSNTRILGWRTPEGLAELLVERCLAAAEAARDCAVEARLSFARAPLADGLAHNRRDHPLAAELAVLDVRAAAGGERLGMLANLGIHPTVTGSSNMTVGTDWIGPMRQALEQADGGMAVFLQGCQGDVNPNAGRWYEDKTRDQLEVAALYGQAIASSVLEAVEQAQAVAGQLSVVDSKTLRMRPSATLLGVLAFPWGAREPELIQWQLGAVRLVTVPGEGFHALEQGLLQRHGRQLLIAGLAPHWHDYLPVPFTKGYEEGLSYGRKAVDKMLEELIPG